MHAVDNSRWRKRHDFDTGNPLGERNTRRVIVLTALMMVAEIVGGLWFHSCGQYLPVLVHDTNHDSLFVEVDADDNPVLPYVEIREILLRIQEVRQSA